MIASSSSSPSAPRLKGTASLCRDPQVLQRHFVQCLRAWKAQHPLALALVIVPTRLLLDQLSVALAAEGALVGVQLHHYRSLAEWLLRQESQPVPSELPDLAKRFLLQTLLDPERSPLERYLSSQPRALSALQSTFRDLRDAGLDRAPPEVAGLSRRGRATLALFDRVQQLERALEGQGFGSNALLVTRASERLRGGAAPFPFEAVFHYGAYDLIGVHRELVRAVAERCKIQWWIPGPAAGPGSELPQRLVHSQALEAHPLEGRTGPEHVDWCSAPDPAIELSVALRRLLHWHHRDQVPLAEMALLARQPEDYRQPFRRECRALGLDAATRLAEPTSSLPDMVGTRMLLHLLRRPASRRARQRWQRLEATLPGPQPSLEARLTRWTGLSTVAETLDTLQEWLEALPGEQVGKLLEACRSAAPLLDARDTGNAAKPELFLQALEVQLKELAPTDPSNPPPPYLLGVEQARGLPWRRACLLGCNEGSFPRVAREDVFLSDDDRRHLAQSTGKPLAAKLDVADEEELLFALVANSVQEHLTLSILQQDGQGRAKSPSPYLRSQTSHSLTPERTTVLSPHPQQQLEALADEFGLLTSREALLLGTLGGTSTGEPLEALAKHLHVDEPLLLSGWKMVQCIEAFDGSDLTFDGHVGNVSWTRTLSVSAWEKLGRCPLQFLFRHGFGIDEPQGGEDLERSPLEQGNLVHDVLHQLYSELFDPANERAPQEQKRWAAERLATLFHEHQARTTADRPPLPVLDEVRAESWIEALRTFVSQDLEILHAEGFQSGEFEAPFEFTLDLGEHEFRCQGRLDRILRQETGQEWLLDYKTSNRQTLLKKRGERRILQGLDLQLPLYWLARRQAGQEVNRLSFASIRPTPPTNTARATAATSQPNPYVELDLELLKEQRKELLATLQELARLRQEGRFPLASDASPTHGSDDLCTWCAYRQACRHTHVPTLQRNETHAVYDPWMAIRHRPKESAADKKVHP